MGDCGCRSESMEGGFIKSADIIHSDLTNCAITNGSLDTISLRNLTELDEASTNVICEAFVRFMTPAQLQTLAEKILQAMQAAGSAPAKDVGDGSLPVKVLGERTALMGEPQRWVTIGDGVIPCYRKD